MNSVQPQQRSTPTNGEQTKLRDEMRDDGQTITHEVALPYLRPSTTNNNPQIANKIQGTRWRTTPLPFTWDFAKPLKMTVQLLIVLPSGLNGTVAKLVDVLPG
jgi:hypothetical protein